MTLCWKYLDHSQNNYEGLTQWAFLPPRPTPTYTTINLNNLKKFLEANQCIDYDRCNKKISTLTMTFYNTTGEANPYIRFGIRTTGGLISHPRTSFRINVCWYNKYDTQKSTINKIWLEWITWRRLELVSV